MPLFNESYEEQQSHHHHYHTSYVYSLADCFSRKIPVISIEFNPPPISSFEKQEAAYWQNLSKIQDEEDAKIIKSLRLKIQGMKKCQEFGSFISLTDSAAGILRMHNLTLIRLFSDASFTEKWLES